MYGALTAAQLANRDMPAALQVLKVSHNKVTQLAVLAGCSSLKVGWRQADICLSIISVQSRPDTYCSCRPGSAILAMVCLRGSIGRFGASPAD